MRLFAVIQKEYEEIDPEFLGPLLEQELGMIRYDAMKLAREGKGILAERIGSLFSLPQMLENAGAAAKAAGKPDAARCWLRQPFQQQLTGVRTRVTNTNHPDRVQTVSGRLNVALLCQRDH